mmetsp:Transcript_14613/g.30896  ORF Transcript_14613/g.30896 Transcript_14613/m.30896 type:complete len:244 (+) Transcript_14613:485-1216(+)
MSSVSSAAKRDAACSALLLMPSSVSALSKSAAETKPRPCVSHRRKSARACVQCSTRERRSRLSPLRRSAARTNAQSRRFGAARRLGACLAGGDNSFINAWPRVGASASIASPPCIALSCGRGCSQTRRAAQLTVPRATARASARASLCAPPPSVAFASKSAKSASTRRRCGRSPRSASTPRSSAALIRSVNSSRSNSSSKRSRLLDTATRSASSICSMLARAPPLAPLLSTEPRLLGLKLDER